METVKVRIKSGSFRGLYGMGVKLEDGGWSVKIEGYSGPMWFMDEEVIPV